MKRFGGHYTWDSIDHERNIVIIFINMCESFVAKAQEFADSGATFRFRELKS